MKRSNKFLLGGVFVLLIGGSAYLNYLKAQPQEQLSDLTLANIEAMALHFEYGNVSSCPWPAEPFATCTEITQFPDGEVVSVQIKGRSATYDPAVPPYVY